jgi:hypothetical protein
MTQMDLSTFLQISQVVAYIVGAVVFILMMRADIRVLRHDMASMKIRQDALNDAFSQLTTILTKVAVQDTRINAIEEDVRELRHGDGYIVKRENLKKV